MDIITRKPYISAWIKLGVFVLALILAFLLMNRWLNHKRQEAGKLLFHEGQVVERVLGGQVQIIKVDPFDSKAPYQVRFPNGEVHWVRAYEIQSPDGK